MDPATWSWLTCAWLIETSVAGILGNRLDARATDVWAQGWQAFDQKLRGGGRAVINHDLAVAVHRAFLLAQRSLVSDCLGEFTGGTWTELGINAPVALPGYKISDIEWLQGKLRQVKADIQKLEKGNFENIPTQALVASERLFQADQELGDEETKRSLRAQLATTVFEQTAPVAYRERATAERTGLFERLSAFFAFELKTNPSVQGLFQDQLLVQINEQLIGLSAQPLVLDELEKALKEVAKDLPAVLASIDNLELAIQDLGKSVDEVGWLVAQRTDELIRVAITHTDDLAQIKLLLADVLIELQSQHAVSSTVALVKTNRVREGPNPFTYGPAVSPEGFYGRRQNLADIRNRIGGIEPQSINIVGLRRNGKSSILRYVKGRTEEFCSHDKKPLVVLLDLQDRRFHQPSGIVEGLRRAIAKQTGAEPWASATNDDPFEVGDGLETLRDTGYRLIVMFDEFEAISKRLEAFRDWGDDWRSKASSGLVTLVIASKRPVGEIYQTLELTSPFDNVLSTTILGALKPDPWQRLLQAGGLSANEKQWVDSLAGKLPYYTQLAAAMIWQHGSVDLAHGGFAQQSQQRFEELWRELQPLERSVLQCAAKPDSQQSPCATTETLKLHGLLQTNGQLCGSALSAFVRQQP